MRATAGQRNPAGEVELPRVGPRSHRPRPGRVGIRVHGAPLAGQGRHQALAASDVDLSPRPELRHQSRPGPRPLPAAVRRPRPARRRLRHQRRRETRRAGPPSHPRQPPRRPRPSDAGRARVHPRRHPGLPGRLRRAPRPSVRPMRTHHRDRPVHQPRGPGHDDRTVRLGSPRVLGRGQRILTPRRDRREAAHTTPTPTPK